MEAKRTLGKTSGSDLTLVQGDEIKNYGTYTRPAEEVWRVLQAASALPPLQHRGRVRGAHHSGWIPQNRL